MQNLNMLIEESAKTPSQGTQAFLIHTDPSLGNIMFKEDNQTNEIIPYLIDFGDVCVFDLNIKWHRDLLAIFQKYVTGVQAINPGWDRVRQSFEDEIDAINDGSLDEKGQFLLRIFKAKLKDTMEKYKIILDSTSKLLAGPLKQVIESIPNYFNFNNHHPLYKSINTITNYMNRYKSDDLDDFQFTQVAINLFDLDFDNAQLKRLTNQWTIESHNSSTGGSRRRGLKALI